MVIAGLVVPWGSIALSRGRKYRFLSGSLVWPALVWLLRDHDRAQRVGRVTRWVTAPAGLCAWADPLNHAAARRAAALVADGALTGFSVGLAAQPTGRLVGGVFEVTHGVVEEVTLTATPANSAARAGAF